MKSDPQRRNKVYNLSTKSDRAQPRGIAGERTLLAFALLTAVAVNCGTRAARPPAAAMTKPPTPANNLCFGGPAEVVLADAYHDFGPALGRRKELHIGNGALLWGNTAMTTAWLDLATLKRSGGANFLLKASDGHEAFGASLSGLLNIDRQGSSGEASDCRVGTVVGTAADTAADTVVDTVVGRAAAAASCGRSGLATGGRRRDWPRQCRG